MNNFKDNKTYVFSGAGCIIFEDINTLNDTTDIKDNTIIILFKDYTKTYADPGGLYEKKHGYIENTAITELKEESKNTIVLKNINYSNYIDAKYKNHVYRSFLLQINGIEESKFHHNKDIIDKYENVPDCWNETHNIKKFYMKDLKKNIIIKKSKYCPDIYGENHRIRRRTRELIKLTNKIKIKIKTIRTKLTDNKDNKKDFLKKTKSYLQY